MIRVDFNAPEEQIAFLKARNNVNLTTHLRLALKHYIYDLQKKELNVASSQSKPYEKTS